MLNAADDHQWTQTDHMNYARRVGEIAAAIFALALGAVIIWLLLGRPALTCERPALTRENFAQESTDSKHANCIFITRARYVSP
jgi:hypothetical protein